MPPLTQPLPGKCTRIPGLPETPQRCLFAFLPPLHQPYCLSFNSLTPGIVRLFQGKRCWWRWPPTATSGVCSVRHPPPAPAALAQSPAFRQGLHGHRRGADPLPDGGQGAWRGPGRSPGVLLWHRSTGETTQEDVGAPSRGWGQSSGPFQRGAWPPAGPAARGAGGNQTRCCRRQAVRVRVGRLRGTRSLTARSGLRLSLCDTARMTPARQPRQQRPLSRRSGRASSPTATHRNRFPTSSSRVSTAIAITAEAAAASSTAGEPVKPCSYWQPMRRRADWGSAAAPRASERGLGGAPVALPRRAQRPRSLTVLNTPPDSPTSSLSDCSYRHTRTHTHTNWQKSPHPGRRRRPWGNPGRCRYLTVDSTTPPPHPLAS